MYGNYRADQIALGAIVSVVHRQRAFDRRWRGIGRFPTLTRYPLTTVEEAVRNQGGLVDTLSDVGGIFDVVKVCPTTDDHVAHVENLTPTEDSLRGLLVCSQHLTHKIDPQGQLKPTTPTSSEEGRYQTWLTVLGCLRNIDFAHVRPSIFGFHSGARKRNLSFAKTMRAAQPHPISDTSLAHPAETDVVENTFYVFDPCHRARMNVRR